LAVHEEAEQFLFFSFTAANIQKAAIFETYLKEFSKYKQHEYKIVVKETAGFHSTKNIKILENIFLLRINRDAPERGLPCEQLW
jgi:hypothetical protein